MKPLDFFKILVIDSDFPVNQINLNTTLKEDLDLDSLDLLDISMNIENEFRIIIPDHEIENWKIVGDILDSINKHS